MHLPGRKGEGRGKQARLGLFPLPLAFSCLDKKTKLHPANHQATFKERANLCSSGQQHLHNEA